jgi:ubiquitin C-terminal hydrolase
MGEEKIKFIPFMEDNNKKVYSFILRNENLSSRTLEQGYKNMKPSKLNPNQFRLIGLENVGATCYMNATLQCFINVPTLTQYLLTDEIFKKITQNSHSYELSSAYCYLLFHVCCDENVTKHFKPQEFKDVISWKNPLFKGVNANDSKDLINFLLE